MRPVLLMSLPLLLSAMANPGYSECLYFRVAAKLRHCEKADEKTFNAKDPYQAAPLVPELDEPTHQMMIHVACDCDYSLQGSDVRCEMDQSVEKLTVLGVDDPAHSCRRGDSLCHDVCPARLP